MSPATPSLSIRARPSTGRLKIPVGTSRPRTRRNPGLATLIDRRRPGILLQLVLHGGKSFHKIAGEFPSPRSGGKMRILSLAMVLLAAAAAAAPPEKTAPPPAAEKPVEKAADKTPSIA